MATVTIRNLAEETRRALKTRAARHNRSMEQEIRQILDQAVTEDYDFVGGWLCAAEDLRGDFEIPARSQAREVDLS